MDGETRKKALEKLNHVKLLIGYPDEILDREKLDDYHKDLVIDSESYLLSRLNIDKFLSVKSFKMIGKVVELTDWTGDFGKAASVNALYRAQANAMS